MKIICNNNRITKLRDAFDENGVKGSAAEAEKFLGSVISCAITKYPKDAFKGEFKLFAAVIHGGDFGLARMWLECLDTLGHYKQADKLLGPALEVLSKTQENSEEVARLRGVIGEIYYRQGDFDLAKTFFSAAEENCNNSALGYLRPGFFASKLRAEFELERSRMEENASYSDLSFLYEKYRELFASDRLVSLRQAGHGITTPPLDDRELRLYEMGRLNSSHNETILYLHLGKGSRHAMEEAIERYMDIIADARTSNDKYRMAQACLNLGLAKVMWAKCPGVKEKEKASAEKQAYTLFNDIAMGMAPARTKYIALQNLGSLCLESEDETLSRKARGYFAAAWKAYDKASQGQGRDYPFEKYMLVKCKGLGLEKNPGPESMARAVLENIKTRGRPCAFFGGKDRSPSL